MVQMIISTPQLAERLPAVVWNYADVKEGVERKLAQYKDRVYTADMIGGAKADRAGLNKLADAIAAKRREVKAWYLEPFQAFENQCKEVEGMIAEASGEIDAQVKAFEAAEKDAKRAALAAYYDETAGELREMVPVTAIFNPKWLNKSYRLESSKLEIDAAVLRILAEEYAEREDTPDDLPVVEPAPALHRADAGRQENAGNTQDGPQGGADRHAGPAGAAV